MRVLMITAAPQGTLGDPSLCKKAIEELQSRYPDAEIDLHVYSIAEDAAQSVINLFKNHNKNIVIRYRASGEFERPGEEEKYDAVVMLPLQVMRRQITAVKEYAAELGVPCVYMTNYDMDFDYEQAETTFPKDIEIFKIGIGQECAGVFKPQLRENPFVDVHPARDKIREQMQASDYAVLDLLMPAHSEKNDDPRANNYHEDHRFYFGYHNKMSGTDGSIFKVKDFVKLCLNKNDDKNVDFLLNVYQDGEDVEDSCKVSSVLEGIDLNEYRVEFYERSGNTFKLSGTYGEEANPSKKVCRIINPFPLAAKSFQALLAASEPLTYQTGNSSIFEAIALNKIPIYQITHWSKQFNLALRDYAAEHLGANSVYCQFFDMINNYNFDSEKIADFLYANNNLQLQAMQQEMLVLKARFGADKRMDLTTNLIHYMQKQGVNFNKKSDEKERHQKSIEQEQGVQQVLKNLSLVVKKGEISELGEIINQICKKLIDEGDYEFVDALFEKGLAEQYPFFTPIVLKKLDEMDWNKPDVKMAKKYLLKRIHNPPIPYSHVKRFLTDLTKDNIKDKLCAVLGSNSSLCSAVLEKIKEDHPEWLHQPLSKENPSETPITLLLGLKSGWLRDIFEWMDMGDLGTFIDTPNLKLLCAAIEGNVSLAQQALKEGAKLDTRDANGKTPLLVAVQMGKLEVVRFLAPKVNDINELKEAVLIAGKYGKSNNHFETELRAVLSEKEQHATAAIKTKTPGFQPMAVSKLREEFEQQTQENKENIDSKEKNRLKKSTGKDTSTGAEQKKIHSKGKRKS